MSMSERAYAYPAFEETASPELRQMRLLSGAAARDKANARRSDYVKLTLAVIAVLVYLLGVTFMESKIGDAGAEINNLKEQIARTENDSLMADLEIGELSSLERIESYAVSDLGMVPTDANSIYYLNKESSMMIAMGEQQLAAAAAEAPPPEEQQYPFWQSVGSLIKDYLGGTALAADNSGGQ